MIEAQCIRTCYDSESCKLYEVDRTYSIDEKAFAPDGGNGLLVHFLPFSQMDRDQVRVAEKAYIAQREHEARAAANTRSEAMRAEPSEKRRVKAKA